MSSRFGIKRKNFSDATQRLQEAIEESKQPGASGVIRDGVIQRFEFTYELAWKTTKSYLELIGIAEVNSPKAVIKEAYAQRLISDEAGWLQMLRDRNMTSHMYNNKIAEEILARIQKIYIREFELLLEKLIED